MAAAVPEHAGAALPLLHPELGVVLRQVVPVPVPVRLDSRDAAAVPLRPADAARMEVPHPARDRQPARDRAGEGAGAVMAQAIAFYILAACILGFAVLVISTKDTVHSVLFLVLDFLFVAALYVLMHAEFLAVIQVLVYAGGIVVLYLFVVMLVNLKRPPEAHKDPHRLSRTGIFLAAAVLLELGGIAVLGGDAGAPAAAAPS